MIYLLLMGFWGSTSPHVAIAVQRKECAEIARAINLAIPEPGQIAAVCTDREGLRLLTRWAGPRVHVAPAPDRVGAMDEALREYMVDRGRD